LLWGTAISTPSDIRKAAAAPELLEACKDLLLVWCGPKRSETIHAARAAIAKAEGGAA
jgi:hypothetical protein